VIFVAYENFSGTRRSASLSKDDERDAHLDPSVAPAEKGEIEMFSHLIESDLHTGELKRRGTFFLGTMAAYAILLMVAGVISVYAYEAHVDDQNLELIALVPPEIEERTKVVPQNPKPEPSAPVNTGGQRSNSGGGLIKNIPSNVSTDLTKIAGAAKGDTTQTPPVFSTGERKFDPKDYSSLIGGDGNNKGGKSNVEGDGDNLVNEAPPPVVRKAEQPPQKERIPYIGPVNGRAVSLPQPAYPPVAKAAGAQGPVTVEILIDEAGRVLSARATGGHPLLRLESEKAAFRARFSPTLLQNQPVKVKGVITFNFILNR
jgi:TonB family protein